MSRKVALVNFDQLIERLRFNLGSAKSAMEHGEAEILEESEALQDYVDSLEETIRKLEVAREVSQKERLDEEDIRRAMSITCYGNIGYCCGLTKVCLWRDSCRQALGIDDKTYVEVKEAVIRDMLERINRMNNQH
jgi:predicted metal-binding transcription factor (methanogenesis marker protein 9)